MDLVHLCPLEPDRGDVLSQHLDPASLQGLAPEGLETLELTLHPTARIVPSSFPILTIWEINQPEVADIPAVDFSAAQRVLVVRLVPGLPSLALFAIVFTVAVAAPWLLHGLLLRNRWSALIFLGESGGRR